MSSTYSTTLRLELIGNGDQSGTWGDTTNLNLGTLLQDAITGVVSITMLDADYTLTAYNGLPDEARNAVLVVGGTNTAQRNVIAPNVEKLYLVKNSTSGGFGIQIKGSTGTGVVVPTGATQLVYCDGTNFYGATLAYAGSTGTGNGVLATSPTIASPTLTGTPISTTAAPGTNTTQIATTAFVAAAVTAATGALGSMSAQNANAVAITGGTINSLTVTSMGTNTYGTRTVSTSSPTGGSDGDIWYKY